MRLINIAEVVNEEEGKPPISITECECDLILDSIYRIIERSDLKKERIPIETEKFLNDCESKNIEKIGKDF
jgi:hypothetical protein